MEQREYYVSVQAKTIMDNIGDAAYEFIILASPEDIDVLVELFENQEDIDEQTFLRTPLPSIPYHHDDLNDEYDAGLKEVYTKIHALGTLETKKHIESMGILNDNRTEFVKLRS